MKHDSDKLAEETVRRGLLRAAMGGKTETCPLCGQIVLSVAVHFASCSKTKDELTPGPSPAKESV